MRRRWERKHVEQQQPQLDLADFPQLQPQAQAQAPVAGRSSRSRHRSSSLRRSASRRRSASCSASRKGKAARSKERVAWVDVVKPPASKQAPAKSPPSPEMIALRTENDRLKHRVAEQDARIAEMNEKLDRLLALQQQSSTPSQDTSIEEMADEESATDEPEPQAKRRATDAPKGSKLRAAFRRLEERFNRHEERFNRHKEAFKRHAETTNKRLAVLEATTANINTRLTALEQTCQAMQNSIQAIQETLIQIKADISRPGPGSHYPQPNQRPTWPEQP